MTQTFLRTTKGAMLSVAVLLALGFMNVPASAQTDDDHDASVNWGNALAVIPPVVYQPPPPPPGQPNLNQNPPPSCIERRKRHDGNAPCRD